VPAGVEHTKGGTKDETFRKELPSDAKARAEVVAIPGDEVLIATLDGDQVAGFGIEVFVGIRGEAVIRGCVFGADA